MFTKCFFVYVVHVEEVCAALCEPDACGVPLQKHINLPCVSVLLAFITEKNRSEMDLGYC